MWVGDMTTIMTSWLQLWRNAFFRIFDIEYLRNRKRHRHNSFTVVIYSTKAIIWRAISIMAKKQINFRRYHKKSYAVGRVWMSRIQITFQHENISSISEISWKMCGPKVKFNMPSRPQLWRHDCIYDVMHFFECFTSKISGMERDTDIILSLLQSTRQRLSSGVLFQ